jgi:hypothetical protein
LEGGGRVGRCPPSTARGSHTASWPAYMSFICTRSPAADSLLKFCLLLQLLPIPPRVEGRKRYSKSASAREWGSRPQPARRECRASWGARLTRLGRKDLQGKSTQQAGTRVKTVGRASGNGARHEKEIYVVSLFLPRERERDPGVLPHSNRKPGTTDHSSD